MSESRTEEQRTVDQSPGGCDQLSLIRGISHFLAHDLGNAISALTLTIDLLAIQDMPEKPRELVRRIAGLQGRLQKFVDGLGALGGARPRAQTVEVRPKIETLLKEMKLGLRFQLELELESLGNGSSLQVDGNLLEFCLRLLLRNAVEATPSGGRLGLRASWLAGYLRLTVWDEGEGVPAEHRDKLFRSAFSTKAGTGVALLLVRAAVEGAMGGKVSFGQNQPRGSCFSIDLPG